MFEFKFNDIGEGLEEGKIADILVREGQSVKEGDPVFSVETDKVTTELPAPVNGVINKILVKTGDTVHVGTTIAYIEQGGSSASTYAVTPATNSFQQQAAPAFNSFQQQAPAYNNQVNNFAATSQGSVDFIFNDVGEGLTEGKVADILKKNGDFVKEGDPVFSVETDKVTTELYAPKTGTIAAILVNVGQEIRVGQVIAKINLSAAAPAPTMSFAQPQPQFQQPQFQPQQTQATSEPASEGGASVVGEVKVSNKVLPLFGSQKKK